MHIVITRSQLVITKYTLSLLPVLGLIAVLPTFPPICVVLNSKKDKIYHICCLELKKGQNICFGNTVTFFHLGHNFAIWVNHISCLLMSSEQTYPYYT